MRTGSLRHRVILQEEVRSSDTAGGYVRSWQDVATLWAEMVSFGTGKETAFAGQLQSVTSQRVRLRYRDGVTAGMRLLFGEWAFNIRGVVNVGERNETLELVVEEGVAA